MNKALFLDLDGTIIETKSDSEFPINVLDWKFKEGILNKIKKYYDSSFNIVIVSNQGGIQLGYLVEKEFNDKLSIIVEQIEKHIEGSINYAYCKDMISYYRKPNPGMAYKFALELQLNLRESIMVGDREEDNGFAKNAYIGTFFTIDDFLISA